MLRRTNIEFKVDISYKITLSPAEFRLISKALRGVLKPDDIETAKALQELLLKERASQLRSYADEMEKHVKNIKDE